MNNLNSRERTLLLVILSFLPLGGLYYSWTTYRDMREHRLSGIFQAEEDKNRLHQLSLTAMKEMDRFDDAYNAASLPLSVADNTVSYQNFLSDLMLRNGLEAKTGSVKLESVEYETTDRMNKPVKEKAYDRITISDSTAKGSVRQLTDFLYDFYDLAMLHRIDSISVDLAAPEKEDETRLSIKFSVSAVILPSGPDTKNWSEYLTGRLNKPRSALDNLVVARNLFGPPNVAPKISSRSSASVEVGSSFSHRFTANDDNEDDVLTFELVSSDLEGFELTTAERGRTATLRGPKVTKAGRFKFNVRVSDNRLPLLSDEQLFTLTVTEPEPEVIREPEPPKPPKKYAPDTYITSLLSVDGVATVVLNNRGKDEQIRCNEGETFELDGKTWTVLKIDFERRVVTLRMEDELMEFKIGTSLTEPLSTSKAVTTTESAAR